MAIMAKTIKVLLAGESWMSVGTHIKGFDQFTAGDYQTGIRDLAAALAATDVELVHMPGHLVATEFPFTLDAYDVVVLSDVGANTLLLHPDTFLKGKRTPNRLTLLAEWVGKGGGFAMIGGYYTFQGIYGAARYRGTAVEKILPVSMLATDDRVEVPEGFIPTLVDDHPIIAGLVDWPYLLGFNETELKPGATHILSTGGADAKPLLAVATHGKGRTLAWTSDIGPHWLPQPFIDWPGYAALFANMFRWLAKRM
jgi:uncharacterized membrane protein